MFCVDFTLDDKWQIYVFLHFFLMNKDSNVFFKIKFITLFFTMIQVFIFIRKKKKINETTHFRKSLFCSESIDQASLHATILVGFLGVIDLKKNWESFDQASLHATILVEHTQNT